MVAQENAKKIYVGLIFNELIIIDNNKNVLERIALKSIDDNLRLLSEEKTEYEQEIEEKYKDSKIVYLFEKEKEDFEINHELLDVLLNLNKDKVEDIKNSSKEILERKMEENLTKDKQIVLLFDAINHYEKIINESVVRIKELAVYLYPGVYEQYRSNKEFIDDLSKGELRHKPLLESIIKNREYKDIVTELSKNVRELIKIKEKMESTIEKMVKEVMPNTSYLLGPKLAAHLLSEMGSLEKLAYAPSSTIQVIGAERSLFIHLLGKGKSPKHGIIFLSEYIQKVPKKHRGKVARVLALKISKAAKMDYFSKGKEFIGKILKEEMEMFVRSLR